MTLRKHQKVLYEKITKGLSNDYLKDGFDLTEKDKEKAHCRIQQMANDLFRLKDAFENHPEVKQYQTFKTLVSVFSQQCEVKEDSNDGVNKEKVDHPLPSADAQVGSPAKADPSLKDKSANEAQKDKDSDQSMPISEPLISLKEDQSVTTSDEKEDKEDGLLPLPPVEIREKPEGEKIISSPHNTDAEYTKKKEANGCWPQSVCNRNMRPKKPIATDHGCESGTIDLC